MNIKIFLNELYEVISSIQNEIINSVRDQKAHTELDSYINSLKTNPYSIANITNQSINELLSKYDSNHILLSESELDLFYEKLDVLRSLAFGRNEGIGFSYNEKELNIINKLIDLFISLKNILIAEESKLLESKTPEYIIDYKKLYEKLLEGISGTEYFEQEEIELIMSITKDKDFNYRVSLLQNIYYLNNEISKRRERLSK